MLPRGPISSRPSKIMRVPTEFTTRRTIAASPARQGQSIKPVRLRIDLLTQLHRLYIPGRIQLSMGRRIKTQMCATITHNVLCTHKSRARHSEKSKGWAGAPRGSLRFLRAPGQPDCRAGRCPNFGREASAPLVPAAWRLLTASRQS